MWARNRIRAHHIERQAEGYLELGLPEHALEILQRLGGPEEYTPHALCLAGEACRDLKRYPEALEYLQRAAEAEPENIRVRLAMAWCHKRTGQLGLAIRDMETALRHEPNEAILHYNLACYLSLAGEKSRALEHLSRALALDADYRNLIDTEPDFDPIRSDPEFQALTNALA